MKSLRLTQQIRDSIVKSFGDKRRSQLPEPEIKTTRAKLKESFGKELHSQVYGHIDLSNVPEDLINVSNGIKVQWPDEDISVLYFGDDEDGETIYLPCTVDSKVEIVLTKDNPAYIKYKQGLDKYKKDKEIVDSYLSDERHYLGQVRQVVNAVNTTKQLLEAWPEAEQFIPDDIKDPSSITLPSVNIAELNKQI